MRRKLFNILAAVSLGLLSGIVIVGVRSFWWGNELLFANESESPEAVRQSYVIDVKCNHGGISVIFMRWTANVPEQVFPLPRFSRTPGRIEVRPVAKSALTYPRLTENVLGCLGGWTGFGVGHSAHDIGDAAHRIGRKQFAVVILPAWFPALLFVILPSIWLRRRMIARKSNRLGLCRNCGYDLRATPQRCPECGTIAASPVTPAA
ncbi:MAG TPA: hypothetical protein VIL86_12710 [Tepidisphaeraceae bacterium]